MYKTIRELLVQHLKGKTWEEMEFGKTEESSGVLKKTDDDRKVSSVEDRVSNNKGRGGERKRTEKRGEDRNDIRFNWILFIEMKINRV